MNVQLEDIVKLLEEVLHSKSSIALVPNESVYKQYAMLGEVAGVRSCIRKLDNLRRSANYP